MRFANTRDTNANFSVDTVFYTDVAWSWKRQRSVNTNDRKVCENRWIIGGSWNAIRKSEVWEEKLPREFIYDNVHPRDRDMNVEPNR